MKKNKTDYALTAIGLLLLAAGLWLVKANPAQAASQGTLPGMLRALPYVCIGLGCGVFGQGMGNLLSRRAVKNNPDIQKQLVIDQNDERNVAIANRAKAKAYDMMIPVFGALLVSFALMGIDTVVVLLLVFAYLFVVGFGLYHRFQYEKKM